MPFEENMPVMPEPRFARFSRRLRGMVIDWMIATAVIFGAIAVVVTVRSDNFSRALGILVVIVLLLYEPVLVSFTGGTLGHYFSNLRIVDDRGGNVSFLKACARFVIKGALGWFSFLVITATRRSQALHDLWTRSTVQIRDPAKALPRHYVTERRELLGSGMPSRLRRISVICVYMLLILAAFVLVLVGLLAAGVISRACLYADRCAVGERYLNVGITLAWLAASAISIGLGWRGRLIGVRDRPEQSH